MKIATEIMTNLIKISRVSLVPLGSAHIKANCLLRYYLLGMIKNIPYTTPYTIPLSKKQKVFLME